MAFVGYDEVRITHQAGIDLTSDEITEIAIGIKDDIKQLTNLTRLIEQTPIANLTENIRFDEIENLMKLLGLDNFINVTAAV